MAENEITASLLGSIERMERHTPPMELAVIAKALEVSDAWFVGPRASQRALPSQRAFDQLQQALVDLGLATDPSTEEASTGEDASDRQPPAAEGGAG